MTFLYVHSKDLISAKVQKYGHFFLRAMLLQKELKTNNLTLCTHKTVYSFITQTVKYLMNYPFNSPYSNTALYLLVWGLRTRHVSLHVGSLKKITNHSFWITKRRANEKEMS